MKRIYRNLMVAGLSLAACLPAAAQLPTLTVEVSDVTMNDAKISISSTDTDLPFEIKVEAKTYVEESRGGKDGLCASWKQYYQSMAEEYSDWYGYELSWSEFYYPYNYAPCSTQARYITTLQPGTEYVAYAFALNLDTGEPAAEVGYAEFKTVDAPKSENTFNIRLKKRGSDGTATVSVLTKNDDQYGVHWLGKSLMDWYWNNGLADNEEMQKSFLQEDVLPYIYENKRYTGSRDIELTGLSGEQTFVIVGYEDGVATTDYKLLVIPDAVAAEIPSFDITVSDIAAGSAVIDVTPSDNELNYIFRVVSDDDLPYFNGGLVGFEEYYYNLWKGYEQWYDGTPWTYFYDADAKTGALHYDTTEEDFLIEPNTKYWAIAFALDTEGNPIASLGYKEFTTPDVIPSDNELSAELVSVLLDDRSTDYITYRVAKFNVTATNDDPWAFHILKSSIVSYYDLSTEEGQKEFISDQVASYLSGETFTGSQTIEKGALDDGENYTLVLLGWNGGATTRPFTLDFVTNYKPEEPDVKPTFTMTVDNIDIRDAGYTIVPPTEDMTYFYDIQTVEKCDVEQGGIEQMYNFDIDWWKFMAEVSGADDWTQFITTVSGTEQGTYGQLYYDADTDKPGKLIWNTDYYMYAYGLNQDGTRTTDVNYIKFTTKDRNQDDELTFDITIEEIQEDEKVPGYYYVTATVTPSDPEKSWAPHMHRTVFYDQYELDENFQGEKFGGIEGYLYDDFDRFIYKTFQGQQTITYRQVEPDQDYYLIVCGYDVAPTTYPTLKQFATDEPYSSVKEVETAEVHIQGVEGAIRLFGAYDEAMVYSLDGTLVATLSGETSLSVAPGTYIVKATAAGAPTVAKVLVR